MRYHIDTIPVWDALKLDGECLLCALERKTELGEAERYLGASVMEPDTRVQVNDKGFCRRHHAMLFGMSNRLGHALMLESHMIETRARAEKIWKKLDSAAGTLKGIGLGGRLSGKAKGPEGAVQECIKELDSITDSCLMCETIEENMQRYLHTFLHLYQNDSDFRSRFGKGKGLCLHGSADRCGKYRHSRSGSSRRPESGLSSSTDAPAADHQLIPGSKQSASHTLQKHSGLPGYPSAVPGHASLRSQR